MSKIFVYGTLRKGGQGRSFEGEFLGQDRITGNLYDLGWYPGVREVRGIFDPTKPAIVGEVYEVSEETFMSLDVYEGCGKDPTYPNTGLYYRKQVLTENNVPVWVYIYSQEIPEDCRILSGDWFNAKEETAKCA